MNKHFFAATFGVGALAVLWIATGFLGSQHVLALLMTLLIGAVYGYGSLELHRFRQLSAELTAALTALPEQLCDLNAWLGSVPASLQNPVRRRIEGERAGLPGPALTPYLVGLLVMLGMLGTFLGMVVTLNGAVFALEGTSDLGAIRSAFATPIKGLGLSFGTSVAGVAASAMLGLMAAISRHERQLASHLLDTKIATALRRFTHTFERQETFKALQLQTQALPAVVDQLQAMMARMERMDQQLNARLLSEQTAFHQGAQAVYTELARSVDQSLRASLHHSAQAASDGIRPVVEAAMAGISQEARGLHERMVNTTQAQLDGLTERLHASTARATQAGQEAMLAMAAALKQEWQQSGAQTLNGLQQLLANSEEQARTHMARDNDLLEERSRIMGTLATLLDTIGHVGRQFATTVATESAQLSEVATSITASAVDVASLSDGLRFAVQCFQETSDKLVAHLQRIESAMDKSMARSDDQLAYYVAQAREVIDLSIGSQRDIVEQLRDLADRQSLLGEAVA